MTFTGQLYPYQEDALDLLFERDGRGLLAYSTGTGKTPTSIAAIEELMDVGEITEPGFVVTLSSTKYQWGKSIAKFTDSKYLIIDGPPAKRAKLYEKALDWWDEGIDYFVINYDLLATDLPQLLQLPRGFWVFDESQLLANWTTARYAAAEELVDGSQVRVGLTGTPMSKGKPEQLFGQFRIIDPAVLGTNEYAFRKRYVVTNQFGWDSGYKNLGMLHSKISKASITKLEDDPDVAPYLPTIIPTDTVYSTLDKAGAALYRHISGELQELLDGMVDSMRSLQSEDYGDSSKGKIGQRLTAMRMLVDHPELLRISAARYLDNDDVRGSEYCAELLEKGLLDKAKKSPKLEDMVRYVKEFLSLDPANKVVIFTAFVPMVDLIAKEFPTVGSVTLTGEMTAKQKESARDRFNDDPDVRLFISSDAGGTGIDLPVANLLCNFDRPWTSGQKAQRDGRIKRASSIWKHIKIQDFSVRGSLEERLDRTLEEQRKIGGMILNGTKQSEVELTVGSLRSFQQEISV